MIAEAGDLAVLAERMVAKSCRSALALRYHIHCLVHLKPLAQLEAEMVLHLRQGVDHLRYHLGRVKSLGPSKPQAVGLGLRQYDSREVIDVVRAVVAPVVAVAHGAFVRVVAGVIFQYPRHIAAALILAASDAPRAVPSQVLFP